MWFIHNNTVVQTHKRKYSALDLSTCHCCNQRLTRIPRTQCSLRTWLQLQLQLQHPNSTDFLTFTGLLITQLESITSQSHSYKNFQYFKSFVSIHSVFLLLSITSLYVLHIVSLLPDTGFLLDFA